MKNYTVTTIGMNKGAPRVWVPSWLSRQAGFAPGINYQVHIRKNHLQLEISTSGNRKVSSKGDQEPVVDLNSWSVLEVFQGMERVRIVAQEDSILITPLESDLRRQERLARLQKKLSEGQPLESGSLAFGGGVLDHAVHTGFADAGVKTHMGFMNEIRDDLASHAIKHNDAVDPDTQFIVAPMQEFGFDHRALKHLVRSEIMAMGLPCSGASVAGRAKNKNAVPEAHPEVGHLVVPALNIIMASNPVAIIFENVVPYSVSGSAAILRNTLRDMGYNVYEREFLGTDFGELEARTRWCMVAMTQGIPFDLDAVKPEPFAVRTLADIMEPLDKVDDRWSEMTGLKAKQERDIEAGKGFRMQVYDGSETSIATLTKGIAKNRSTDPKFRHPTDPNLLRIPKACEHARVKGIPEHLFEGLSETTAHELLGQSIIYTPFRLVAKAVAEALKAVKEMALSFESAALAQRVAG